MSMEAELTFDQEMENLTEQWNRTLEKAEALDEFFFSDQFFIDHVKFGKLLGEFQRTLITLTGTYLPYVIGMMQQKSPMPERVEVVPKETEEIEVSHASARSVYARIIIAVAAVIFSYAAVERGWITVNVFYWFLSATVALLSLPQIMKTAYNLWKKLRSEEETPGVVTPWQLERMIQDILTEMRQKYLAIRKLTLVQSQLEMPEYDARGIPRVLYVRREKEREDLPHEFSGKINSIVTQCNTSIWERRTTIIWAMVQAKQAFASAVSRSPAGAIT